jgi:hypothetical protein
VKRLGFILSPLSMLLASCASKAQESGMRPDPYYDGPECPNCGARNSEIKALNDGDETVLYLCKRGHVFGQPWEVQS